MLINEYSTVVSVWRGMPKIFTVGMPREPTVSKTPMALIGMFGRVRFFWND